MKRSIFITIMLLSSINLLAKIVTVNNNSGEHNVWGAVYYVYKDSAQRVGNPRQISNQAVFSVPAEEKPNAARYVIIARSEGLLEPMIVDPFSSVGLQLFSLGFEGATSVTLECSQLPVEKFS